MHAFRALACASFVVATLLVAPWARAQSVTVPNPDMWIRSDDGCSPDAGAAQFDPCGGINYVACANDVTIEFPVTVSDPNMATDHMVVLAGPPNQCFPAAGSKTIPPGCWPVTGSINSLSASMNVTVRAMDIAAFLGSPSPPTTYTKQTIVDTACRAQTCPGPVKLGLSFLVEDSNDEVPAAEQPAEALIFAGTLGPQAPANVSASVNDGYVTITWQPPADTSIYGYNVYCQNYGKVDAAVPADAPIPVQDACADGQPGCVNTVDSGGLSNQCPASFSSYVYTAPSCSGGGTTPVTTDSGSDAKTDAIVLVQPDSGVVAGVNTNAGISEVPSSLLCAYPTDSLDGATTLGSTVSSATVSLSNFDFYTFAVAAVDSLGNVGPLGNLQCGTPGPIKDFWTNYVSDGGLAGGGYCALEGVGMPAGSACMTVGVGMAAVGFLRRRRTRRRSS